MIGRSQNRSTRLSSGCGVTKAQRLVCFNTMIKQIINKQIINKQIINKQIINKQIINKQMNRLISSALRGGAGKGVSRHLRS
jgi:hypothetical protein